jgi:molecular chaperone GrpE (heat shock protein)
MNSPSIQYDVWQDYFDSSYSSTSDVESTQFRKATFSEILTYAVPQEKKILVFNRLIKDISIAQREASLDKRDDFKVSEAMILLSDILDTNWSFFSPEIKILLLDRLQLFNKSYLQIALYLLVRIFTPRNLTNNLNQYKIYASEYESFDKNSKKNINQSASSSLGLVCKSLLNLKKTTEEIFKKDGLLLKKNRRSILEIIESLQILSPQFLKNCDDDGVVHAYNYKGEPFDYNIRDLYWHPNAFDYAKEQEEKFKDCLAELIEKYSNQYVIFEDGLIIDSDINEINLLIRISKNLAYRNRPVVFCKFIPSALDTEKIHA